MLIRLMPQLVIAAALVIGVATAYAQDMSALAFMTGSWVESKGQSEVRETWIGPSADVMVAVNLSTVSTSKTEFEILRIAREADKITYFASPGGRTPATPFRSKNSHTTGSCLKTWPAISRSASSTDARATRLWHG